MNTVLMYSIPSSSLLIPSLYLILCSAAHIVGFKLLRGGWELPTNTLKLPRNNSQGQFKITV